MSLKVHQVKLESISNVFAYAELNEFVVTG